MPFLRFFTLPAWQRGLRPLSLVAFLPRLFGQWHALRSWLPLGSLWAACARQWREFRSPVPFGLQGERAAERYLKRQGFVIVDRRARGGFGEIDLVAVDQRTIVFVEVKSRRSHHRGHPAEAVDPRKQRRLTRLALSWLKRHDLLEQRARFDVVAITWPKTERSPTIKHIRNAFEAAGDGQMFC
ncbi:MAG: YraN family protein [Planctomycetota bacterium]